MVIICTTSLTFTNSTFCPHSVFMCIVWISKQTAIISLYSINWLDFITERERVCLLRLTDWTFKYYPSKAQWSLYVPPVKHSQTLRSAHTVYLCVLFGSQNKQRLFPYTALAIWRVKEESSTLQTIKRRANWNGHTFRHAAAQWQPGRDTVTLSPPSAQRDTPLMSLSGRDASQFLPVPSRHHVNCPVSPTFHSTSNTRRLSIHFLLDHPEAKLNGNISKLRTRPKRNLDPCGIKYW